MLSAIKKIALVLICGCLATAADLYYNIGENERMSIESAVFHAYENAWSVSFLVPTTYSVLVFALCREPCPPVSSEYQLYGCKAMLSVFARAAMVQSVSEFYRLGSR